MWFTYISLAVLAIVFVSLAWLSVSLYQRPPSGEKGVAGRPRPTSLVGLRNFEAEKLATEECRQDVLSSLAHDTSPTRRQFAQVLRERAQLVECEITLDQFTEELSTSLNDEIHRR